MSSISAMPSETSAPSDSKLVIPYGVSALSGAVGESPPTVAIGRAQRMPLRLWHGPYPFAEPPDLTRLKGTAERLAFLKEHLKSLCGLWARPPLDFLDAYFRWIESTLEGSKTELEARGGGLFQPRDWSFAAFRPLPLAHLPVAADKSVRTDLAFWTGDRLAAIWLVGEMTAPREPRCPPAGGRRSYRNSGRSARQRRSRRAAARVFHAFLGRRRIAQKPVRTGGAGRDSARPRAARRGNHGARLEIGFQHVKPAGEAVGGIDNLVLVDIDVVDLDRARGIALWRFGDEIRHCLGLERIADVVHAHAAVEICPKDQRIGAESRAGAVFVHVVRAVTAAVTLLLGGRQRQGG